MPGLNLTRDEAFERSEHLKVSRYVVSIDTTSGAETFMVSSAIHFTCDQVGYSTFIDSVGKRVISAALNGKPLDVSNYDGVTIWLNELELENVLTLEVENFYAKSGEGLQKSIDPVDQEVYLYSQAATAYARMIFPCFDQPDLKASLELSVIAQSNWEVLSNSPVDQKLDLQDGKSEWRFRPTPPISSYIYALIAGPYFKVTDEYVGTKVVPLGIYIRKTLAQFLDAENIFEATKNGFAYFENVFGLAYPFEKYDQIAVVDYNWGAMENPGAVTFREDRFVFRSKVTDREYSWRTSTILHEMAHMWFGDLVTMKWWDDVWLNESFAEWVSYHALHESTRFDNSWVAFNSDIKNWGYRADQLTSTHPVVTFAKDLDTANSNFDGISYAKGASVLKQLFAFIGEEKFIAAIQSYFKKYAWQNTTLQDLLTELEISSGISLKEWAKSWLQTAGVNTLRPNIVVEDGNYSLVSVVQEVPIIPEGSSELRPHKLGIGLYDLENGKLKLRSSISATVTGERTYIPELSGEKVADLLLLNDGDLTFAKIRFDPRSIELLKKHLGSIENPLARTLSWSALWDMTRDAELPARDFVTASLAALESERDSDVISIVLRQIAIAIENYAHPSHRDALRFETAEVFERILNSSEPGSDCQLLFARAFAEHIVTDVQARRVREFLNSGLAGLTVDSNLRWAFARALTEQGHFTKTELDAELANDPTLDGQIEYATCLAAFPTDSAKSQTWNEILSNDLTIAFREAKVLGFHRSSQRHLSEKYVDKYFAQLREFWDRNTYDVGDSFATGMFPRFLNNKLTLDKTEAWLADNLDAPSGLVRDVSEARDALIRDIAAQECDE